MARSKTSLGWLKEHFNDPYVKKAQKDGYRSRASYKLLEIQEKYRLIRPAHRHTMLSNMATSLIMHKRIFTTVPKAKELRKYVEPLITKSKEDTTSSRRLVFSLLQNKYAVTELFQNVSQKVGDRPGGYTRIIKTGYRLGDNAAMCFIELVDYNENMLGEANCSRC